jgi:uncharacterized coiled-coil DUF342 family protein
MSTPIRSVSVELENFLKQLGRRLRLRDGWLFAQRSLWAAALMAVLIQVGGRLFPIENLLWWTAVPLAAWLILVMVITLFQPMPSTRIARRVDLELGLKERLSTALVLSVLTDEGSEIRQNGKTNYRKAGFDRSLVDLQFQDALTTAKSIRPKEAIPLPWLRKPILTAAALIAAVGILGFLPNPMDDLIQERAAIAQEAEEQARKIDELRSEIEESQELSPEMQEELQRLLAELAEQLRTNPGDKAEALAELSKIEEKLREMMDPGTGMKQAALEALAAQLQALAQSDPNQKADLNTAPEDLSKLAEMLQNMNESERQEMAQSLSQMAARAAQSGASDLAQALASMAQAAQANDSESASQAAQAASEALRRESAGQSDQQALQRALSQLQSSRQSMSQAGEGGRTVARQPGQGEGEGEGEGQGQGEGEGEGAGTGQGQGQGSPGGGGGGTDIDSAPPAEGSGQAGRPEGEGQAGGIGDPGSQVYVPWDRMPTGDESVFIPGQDTDQGETQTREQRDPLPGAHGPAILPYFEVYESYLNSANQTIEQSYIPSSLKDYIREYFSQLEP